MTLKDFITSLNVEGCDITAAQYQKFCEVLCVHEINREKGVVEHKTPRPDGGETVNRYEAEIEHPYDAEEIALRKELRSANDAFVNQTYAANRWIG